MFEPMVSRFASLLRNVLYRSSVDWKGGDLTIVSLQKVTEIFSRLVQALCAFDVSFKHTFHRENHAPRENSIRVTKLKRPLLN